MRIETRTSTFWHPRSQATSRLQHMIASSRPSKWSILTTPAAILFLTWKPWWWIQFYNDGRYTSRLQTSTWWLIRTKAPICLTSSLILFWTSWTGIILPGRLTNTWMPSLLASAHLLYWHPTQIHTIRALLCKFKLSLEGILSLRQRDPPDCRRLDPETNSCQTGKENRDSLRNRGIFTYEIHLYYHHYYSQTSSSFELGGRDLWLMVLLLNLYFLTSFSVSFGSRHLSNLYSFIPWRTTLLTFHPGCFLHPTRRLLPVRLPHLNGLKIRHQHHIFLAWPEWFLTLPPFTLFSARRSLTPSLLDLMNFGSWNGQKMVEKLGSRWKLFLENLHLTRDRATLRTTANQWRQYYDVPVLSPSSSTATSFPVLPHPEHTNVHVSQPFDAIPNHIHILQSCWGRSAQHHSQGTTTSLSWPPWRSTPPSSPSEPIRRTLHPHISSTPSPHPHGQVPPDEPGPMDMSDSSV